MWSHLPSPFCPHIRGQNVLQSSEWGTLTCTWMRKQWHRVNFAMFPEDENSPKSGEISPRVELLELALLCLCTALVKLQNLLLHRDHVLVLL